MLLHIWFPALISAFAGFMFMSLAPLTYQFMALFGVGYAGLSLFLSALLWAHTFIQLPAGLILDRLGVYRGFLIAAVIALVANLLPFLSPDSLPLATALRFVAGLSSGMMFLTAAKLTVAMAPPGKTAQAQGMQGAAFSTGIMLPYLILPWLGDEAWRFSYWIPAALALFLLALSFRLPSNIRHDVSGAGTTARELWQTVKFVSTSVPIWTIGIFHGFSYGTLNNLGQWLPSILADMDGKGDVAAWSLGTGAVLLVGTLGRAFASNLLHWYSRSFITNTSVLLIAILYIALGLTGNPLIGLGIGVILAWLGGANFGSIFSLTGQTVSPAYIATAIGFMNLVGNLTNVLLTVILGTVREFSGSFGMTLCAAGLFALVIWIIGYRIIQRVDTQS